MQPTFLLDANLVAARAVSSVFAREVALQIQLSNPHHINDRVMQRFENKLRGLGQ